MSCAAKRLSGNTAALKPAGFQTSHAATAIIR